MISVTDEFGDTLIKSFVLDLLDPTLANFHNSKCTSLRVFDWLVIVSTENVINNGLVYVWLNISNMIQMLI